MEDPRDPNDQVERVERLITMLHSNMVGMQAWMMALAEEMAMIRAQLTNAKGEEAMSRIRQRVERHVDRLAELHEEDLKDL